MTRPAVGAAVRLHAAARMALARGHGALSVPIRTGFTGIAVGMLALSGADLEHLLNTPSLVG